MDTLPTEIIEYILADSVLSLEDISNINLTCTWLRRTIQTSNYIWKHIFLRSWPQYETMVDKTDVNWFYEVKYIYEVQSKVRHLLNGMSRKFYAVSDMTVNDFNDWTELIEERALTSDYVIDYLAQIIKEKSSISSIEVVPLITPGNKTLRYYSSKALQHLRHLKATKDYAEFILLPEAKRVLEKGAVIIAQWCQYTREVTYEDVCCSLDDLASQAREELKVICETHPLFKIENDVLHKWKMENLEHNQFNNNQCLQILDAIKNTLYKKNKYSGNVEDFYMPENSYINIVLDRKCGLPITLSIIYESIARRMGVNCEPLNVPAHFLLRYQHDPTSQVLYIDAFNEGQLYPRGIWPHCHASTERISRATAHKVMRRIAANLEESIRVHTHTKADVSHLRSILELMMMITPWDLNCIINLTRLCMSLNMDTHYIERVIQQTTFDEPQNAENVLKMLWDYEIHRRHEHFFEQNQPKKRISSIQFAVGMVMKHKILNYKGVITGWTPICKATHTWQKSMNIDRLKYKGNQPFYNVIVEDGTERYVAEENVDVCCESGFLYLNDEIGKHFSHFFVNHYVPNKEKEQEYPEDTAVRQSFYQSMLFSRQLV